MKKPPEILFHPLLASSIILQPDQETITRLCTAPFKGHKNGCPSFNANWSCPPNAPNFSETAKIIREFDTFWLVSIIIQLTKPLLWKGFGNIRTKNSAAIQTQYLNYFLDFVKEHSKDSMVFHASHCTLCNERGFKGCTFPDSPCRFPAKMRISPEAGGVDLLQTMNKAGIQFEVNPKTYVTRVGLIGTKGNLSLPILKQEFENKYQF